MKKNFIILVVIFQVVILQGQNPIIDGVIDPSWNSFQWFEVQVQYDSVSHQDTTDFKGRFKLEWTKDTLFLLVEVYDDTLNCLNERIHELDDDLDKITILFDPANRKEYELDNNSVMWTLKYDEGMFGQLGPWQIGKGSIDAPAIPYAFKIDTGYKYVAEFAIPTGVSGYKSEYHEGMMIGFDLLLFDKDKQLKGDKWAWKYDGLPKGYNHSYSFGTIELLPGGHVKGYTFTPKTPQLTGVVKGRQVDLSLSEDPGTIGYRILLDGKILFDTSAAALTLDNITNGVHSISAFAFAEGKLKSRESKNFDFEVIEAPGKPVITSSRISNDTNVVLRWSYDFENSLGCYLLQDGEYIDTVYRGEVVVYDLDKGTYDFSVITFTYDGLLSPESEKVSLLITHLNPQHPAHLYDVFPNPASGHLYLRGKQITGYKIFDLQGKTLLFEKNKQEQDNLLSIDISSLSQGIYLLQVENHGGQLSSRNLFVY
ncbi:MAG: sugar-binding protein [bacterium]